MTQPTAYNRETDFTDREGDDSDHQGVNAELDKAASSINQIRENLGMLQRDDGQLANGIVTADSLADDVLPLLQGAVIESLDRAETAAGQAVLAATVAKAERDAALVIKKQADSAASAAALNAQVATEEAADIRTNWNDKIAAVASSAAGAFNSATHAAGSAAEATSAKALAEAARDAATLNASVFGSIALGLAAVADGVQFQVPASDGYSIARYQRVGNSATLLTTYPTKGGVDSLLDKEQYETGGLHQWLDKLGRRLAYIDVDGTLNAKLAISARNGLTLDRLPNGEYTIRLSGPDGGISVGSGTILADDYDDEVLAQHLDSSGRVLWKVTKDGTFVAKGVADVSGEMFSARGTCDSLSTRLAATIRPDSLPYGPVYGEWNLRETRRILAGIQAGDGHSQLSIAHIGDSWTDTREYHLKTLVRTLRGEYGDAGPGYCGVEAGGADDTTVFVSKSGTWSVTSSEIWNNLGNYVPAPHLRQITSSTPGSRVSISTPGCDSVRLFYQGGGAGSVRYRYNGGDWIALALNGSGTENKALPTPPTGPFSLDVEVVSGTCVVYGFDLQKTGSGIRSHKLGLSGSTCNDWLKVDAEAWQAGLSALGPNLCVVPLGTNDVHQYPASTFTEKMRTFIGRIRAAAPLSDILIVSPPKNLSTNAAHSLYDYAYAARKLASETQCAHLDLQPFFGATPDTYGDTGRRYMVSTDLYHPAVPSGSNVIASAIYRTLKS